MDRKQKVELAKLRPAKDYVSLYEYCKFNTGVQEENSRREKILNDWANKNSVNPTDISYGSRMKCQFKCSICGHEWKAKISHRTLNLTNCPACSNKIVTENNNLLSWCNKNGEYGKKILFEYSKDNEIPPDKIFYGSRSKVEFVCSICKHKWDARLRSRTVDGKNGCPNCAGKVVTNNNSLLAWCKGEGEYGQKLLDEYSQDNSETPDSVHALGDKYIKWKCSVCKHEWSTIVRNRTKLKSGCPRCDKTQTSLGEQLIYYILQRELPNDLEILNRHKFKGKYEIDIYIPELKLGFEYGSIFWHQDRIEKDKKKQKVFKENNLDIKTIMECRKVSDLENYKTDYDLIFMNKYDFTQVLSYVKYVIESYGIEINTSISSTEFQLCKDKCRSNDNSIITEIGIAYCMIKKLTKVAEILSMNISTVQARVNRAKKSGIITQEKLNETPGIAESLTKFNMTPEQIYEQYQNIESEDEFGLVEVDGGSSITLEYIQDVQRVLDKIKNGAYKNPIS